MEGGRWDRVFTLPNVAIHTHLLVTRYTNDAEAIYSFEGTREINSLIVGRSLTGISAFV